LTRTPVTADCVDATICVMRLFGKQAEAEMLKV
jgi:hypothetical protein